MHISHNTMLQSVNISVTNAKPHTLRGATFISWMMLGNAANYSRSLTMQS